MQNISTDEVTVITEITTGPLPLLQGVARFYQAKKRHVITTQTEHKCVLDSCRVLEAEGFSVTYLPVKQNGLLDLEVHVLNILRFQTHTQVLTW